MRVAVAVILQMERAAVNSRVVPFALARAQAHGQTTQGRLMCCALLGAAAVKLSREDIELQFLHKAVALCQVRLLAPLLALLLILHVPKHALIYKLLTSQVADPHCVIQIA